MMDNGSSARIGGPTFIHEDRISATAGRADMVIAGVDEAGRGPIAGPVVTAAVVVCRADLPAGIDDSKRLAPSVRERLFGQLLKTACVAIATASSARIDRTNILAASLWAMAEAVKALPIAPDHVLIDGPYVPTGLGCPAEALVKGDRASVSIAAASIVAKVVRDRMMRHIGAQTRWAAYGFQNHKGYATTAHKVALAALGPSPHHRQRTAPVRAVLANH